MNNTFRTSDGASISGETLQAARNTLAREYLKHADAVFTADYGFAAHVTPSAMKARRRRYQMMALGIARGEYDAQFWCWQKLNYLLTGNSVALLS